MLTLLTCPDCNSAFTVRDGLGVCECGTILSEQDIVLESDEVLTTVTDGGVRFYARMPS